MINLLFPQPVCWSCGLPHEGSRQLCATCADGIQFIHHPCTLCGLSHPDTFGVCKKCQLNPPLWDDMRAPLLYQTPIRQLIQALKFSAKINHLSDLAELVLPVFNALPQKPDLIVPVPLHKSRFIERGFNQSLELAKIFSQTLNIDLNQRLLQRALNTPPQSGLTAHKRRQNIKNAFAATSKIADHHHIAILDDVITTGSTVSEITRVCRRQGVGKISIWALARAV